MTGPYFDPKGIYCLEGEWWGIRDRTTVEPMFELIHRLHNTRVKYVHRTVATIPEFEHHLEKWALRSQNDYPILYLGFHGTPNYIRIGDQRKNREKVSLEWLEERLTSKRVRKRVIYFGSCDTLNVDMRKLKKFVNNTGVNAIFGYGSNVDWSAAAALEIIVLDTLQYWTLTLNGLKAADIWIRDDAAGLARKLKFRMVTRDA